MAHPLLGHPMRRARNRSAQICRASRSPKAGVRNRVSLLRRFRRVPENQIMAEPDRRLRNATAANRRGLNECGARQACKEPRIRPRCERLRKPDRNLSN